MPRFNLKAGKKILIILVPVLIVLLVLLSLIDAVYEPPKEVIQYPEGKLANDIFTEQNNSYVPNENLTKTHEFKEVPYLVDVADGNGAEIGSGTVYLLNDTMFAYVAEYSDPNTIQDIISSQFPAALISDYVPEYTTVVTQVDKRGYINGFSAEYLAENISASNGAQKTDSVLLGYMLNLPENGMFAGNHLWIGVGTSDVTNENVTASGVVLDMMMNTVRLNEDLAKDLQEEADREAERLAEEAARAEEQARIEQSQQQADVQPSATPPDVQEEPSGEPVDADIYAIDIPLDENYEMVQIKVNWSDSNTLAVLELFDPGKTLYFDPVEQTETGAMFVIEGNETGNYELRIKGAASCGVIETPEVNAVTSDKADTGTGDGDKTSDTADGSITDASMTDGMEEGE